MTATCFNCIPKANKNAYQNVVVVEFYKHISGHLENV